MASKKSHKGSGKRQEPLVKGQQRWFTRKSIPNQYGDKIDYVVLAEARSGETYPLLDGFEDAHMGEDLSKSGDFSHPGRNGGRGFRRDLDGDGSMRHTSSVSSLVETAIPFTLRRLIGRKAEQWISERLEEISSAWRVFRFVQHHPICWILPKRARALRVRSPREQQHVWRSSRRGRRSSRERSRARSGAPRRRDRQCR